MIMDIVNINVKDLLIGTAVRTFSQKKEEMISFWVVCWMIWDGSLLVNTIVVKI